MCQKLTIEFCLKARADDVEHRKRDFEDDAIGCPQTHSNIFRSERKISEMILPATTLTSVDSDGELPTADINRPGTRLPPGGHATAIPLANPKPPHMARPALSGGATRAT
jgi:hypothetical protein